MDVGLTGENQHQTVWVYSVGIGVVLKLHAYCMSLVFSASPAAILSLLTDNMENTNGDANGKQDFDTLQLRNRTVTETLSPVEDLGQNKKVFFHFFCKNLIIHYLSSGRKW